MYRLTLAGNSIALYNIVRKHKYNLIYYKIKMNILILKPRKADSFQAEQLLVLHYSINE